MNGQAQNITKQRQGTTAHIVFVVAIVTLGQWDPHRCNKVATVSFV
jgi:hypothetical protein